MTTCPNLITLLASEGLDVAKELDDEKWLLSEQAGRDVGMAYTEQAYFEKFMIEKLMQGTKPLYCATLCQNRGCPYQRRGE